MRQYRLWLAIVAAIVVLAGCSNDNVNIGNGSSIASLGTHLKDYAADWEGYAEAYQFDDKTDKVSLTLDEKGNGVLRVGEAADLPAPDPDKGYPPPPENFYYYSKPEMGLVSGFDYPVSGATVESKRIRLSTSSQELYREWCELQTPILDEYNSKTNNEPMYNCIPNYPYSSGIDPATGKETCALLPENADPIPIDCHKMNLCSFQTCSCAETGCHVSQIYKDVQIDAALESQGEELVGTLLINSERITVRMTRK